MWFMNNFTGELYPNVFYMIRHIVSDMVKIKACCTIKMLDIKLLKGER